MSKLKICGVLILTAFVMGAAYAAPGRGGGGGGGGHFGGGGGAHFGGGGGAHFGGGGGTHFGGGGGAHFGGGARFGGAPRFSGRSSVSHFAARPANRGQHSFAARGNRSAGRGPALNPNGGAKFSGNRNAATLGQSRNANARSNAVRNALNSRAVAGVLHNRAALRNPSARAQIAASAAMAGWHGSGRGGWWRHPHGGFGWVGPVFWPFAYYDIYDYALWGYGYDPLFWDYGYDDIYAGIFSPYGYDDLAGYWPQGGGGPRGTVGRASGGQSTAPDQLAQMCGDDSRDIAGLPIDQIQQSLQLNDVQRAALDDLGNASVKAAQDIKAACPTKIPVAAPERLAAMQQRIEAMIAAVDTVRPPLQKFYDLLNDEQKARLNALVQDQRGAQAARRTGRSMTESCGTAQPGVTDLPTAEIEARLQLNEAQRTSLVALQDATRKAADMLKASCPTSEPITPPARLEAVGKRLDAMLQAVRTVRAALDDLYGKLSDEQKAQFEAIGPRHTALSDQPANLPAAAQAHVRHRHHVSIAGLVRHFMWLAQ
jgi:hypothetical protein